MSRAWTTRVFVIIALLLVASSLPAQEHWWQQQKLRFFWGQWWRLLGGEETDGEGDMSPRQLMEKLSQVGVTVYVEGGMDSARARLAHEYGIRYFGAIGVANIAQMAETMEPPSRLSVDKNGQPYGVGDTKFPCPLSERVYRQWLEEPALRMARSGVVDGLHMDCEHYADLGEAGVCYCDDCFRQFLEQERIEAKEAVPKAERYQWLARRGLVDDYEQAFTERRTAMFRHIAERVRRVKPDFIFSAYASDSYTGWGRATPLTIGLHSPEAPVIILDSVGYYGDRLQWWDSAYDYYHSIGFLYILGSWNRVFWGGSPHVSISPSQWMYQTALNTDGYWLWFQRKLTPGAWQAFETADRRLKDVERKVGDFLLQGEECDDLINIARHAGFPSEPVYRSYRLGNEYLVHITNISVAHPTQVRVRFPHLPNGSRWTVTDPVAGAVYRYGAGQMVWDSLRLQAGVVVSLEARGELFLKLSPVSVSGLLYGRGEGKSIRLDGTRSVWLQQLTWRLQ